MGDAVSHEVLFEGQKAIQAALAEHVARSEKSMDRLFKRAETAIEISQQNSVAIALVKGSIDTVMASREDHIKVLANAASRLDALEAESNVRKGERGVIGKIFDSKAVAWLLALFVAAATYFGHATGVAKP
jgi:hypothetical protein